MLQSFMKKIACAMAKCDEFISQKREQLRHQRSLILYQQANYPLHQQKKLIPDAVGLQYKTLAT